MIKLRKIIISLGVLAICSCSNHSDNVTLPDNEKEPLATLEIGSASTSSVIEITRADPVVITEGTLGAFQTNTNFPYEFTDNVQYTYHGDPTNKWLVVLNEALPLYQSDATICTYMPYNENQTGTSFTLTSQRVTTETEQTEDLLYSPNQTGANVNNKLIDVELKHAYSKITIHIVKGTYQISTERPGNLLQIELSSSMIYSQGSLNIGTEVYSSRTPGPVGSGDIGETITEAGKDISFLMVPTDDSTTYTEGITFAFTLDGLVLKATSTEFTQLLPGRNYKITATFNDSEISPTDPDVIVKVTDFVEVPYEEGTPIEVDPEKPEV